jgi:hypothetical protein
MYYGHIQQEGEKEELVVLLFFFLSAGAKGKEGNSTRQRGRRNS